MKKRQAKAPEGPTGASSTLSQQQRVAAAPHPPTVDAPTFATLNEPESDDELSYGSQEPL